MLCAAVGVTAERQGHPRRIEPLEGRIADLKGYAAGRQAAHQFRRRGEGLARVLGFDGGPRHRAPAKAGLDGIGLHRGKTWPIHAEVDGADSRDLGRRQGRVIRDTLSQDQLVELLEGREHAAVGEDLREIGPDLALDIVQFKGGVGHVAWGQETWQVEIGYDRLAHGQGLRAGAHCIVSPGHGHEAQFAVEVGGGQVDNRVAVEAGVDHARPQGHGLDRRRRQPLAAQFVAAEVHRRRGAQVRIQQPTVVVAVVEGQGALAEIPLCGIGAFLLGQSQDPLVDRRQGDMRLLAEFQSMHDDRHIDRRL